MPHLEPTYLRYIYDGLIKGSIHPENAAELPDGLIGMYEEAFDERTSVVERQKLLQRLAIWALLKKEVSAAFVAEILGETEDDIQDFISTYSAWFNSPESGKYQLYHERLKVYLLQKLSEEEIHSLHEKIIKRLEKAIEAQKADEFEWYGLEFLTSHFSTAAMLNGEGKKLIELAYSQTHWQRQLKISKGYSWTNNGLKQVMTWASKYNDYEVIECGLQMVDLHHQEQNAAPQIVALIAEGEFDAALKRIEQFGGSDKEGLQRKFIIYMLCLMELTLLDSKDKPNRKDGIEKLLKHLDEQLPVDHSVLNWGEFFSSELIFSMLFQWKEIEVDPEIILTRTRNWDFNWIGKLNEIGLQRLEVLNSAINLIGDEKEQTLIEIKISKTMFNQNRMNESRDFEQRVRDKLYSKKLEKTHQISSFLSTVRIYCNEFSGISFLGDLSTFLFKIKQKIELPLEGYWKYKTLQNLSILFAEIGDFDSAVLISEELPDSFLKSELYAIISTHFNKNGRLIESDAFIQKSLDQLAFVTKNWQKCMAQIEISRQLYLQEKTDRARLILNECLHYKEINDEEFGKTLKSSIITEFVKFKKIESALNLLEEITDEITRTELIKEISLILFDQGNYNLAFEFTDKISFKEEKKRTLILLVEKAKEQDNSKVLNELMSLCRIHNIMLEFFKISALYNVNDDGLKKLQNELTIQIATNLSNTNSNNINKFLQTYSCYEASMFRNTNSEWLIDKIESDSSDWVDYITSPKKIQKWLDLMRYANRVNNQVMVDTVLSKILKCLKDITDDVEKCSFQRDLIRTLLEIQKFDIAEELNSQVQLPNWKFRIGVEIFNAFYTKGLRHKMEYWYEVLKQLFQSTENTSEKIEFGLEMTLVCSFLNEERESLIYMENAITHVNSMTAERAKNIARIKVVEFLIKKGLFEKANEQYSMFTIDLQKRNAQKTMVIELSKKGEITRALDVANTIENPAVKLATLIDVCLFYFDSAKINEGQVIFREINRSIETSDSVELKGNTIIKLGRVIKNFPELRIEDLVQQIDNLNGRINFYTNLIISINSQEFDEKTTFDILETLSQISSKKEFLIAWVNFVSPLKIEISRVNYALPLLVNNLKDLEHLLLQFTMKNIIIGKMNDETEQSKFIDVLGLNWAKDIKNQLPN